MKNVGIDGLQIDGPNIHDQASTLWLSHKNGPQRFVWHLISVCLVISLQYHKFSTFSLLIWDIVYGRNSDHLTCIKQIITRGI
jgi:hypothetical protein